LAPPRAPHRQAHNTSKASQREPPAATCKTPAVETDTWERRSVVRGSELMHSSGSGRAMFHACAPKWRERASAREGVECDSDAAGFRSLATRAEAFASRSALASAVPVASNDPRGASREPRATRAPPSPHTSHAP
jgi:hypothetical protein